MSISMIKRFFLALALAAGLLSPAYSAGTIPYSLSQQLDQYGTPLSGCKLYLFAAGTTAPQNAYQDSALTLVLPNPLTCDASGRLPQFFLADGSIKVRLTDKNGTVQVAADGIQVIGPSSGGGGGSTVDATTILATGDVKSRYGTGTLPGFVRLNGRTIGSSTSGATERANADTQALFQYLWQADANLTVSTGRGASANADWIANKTIMLPDGRGRVLAGLDDMGNSDATRLAFSFGATNKTLGAGTNQDYEYLSAGMLPVITPSFSGTTATLSLDADNANFVVNPEGAPPTAGANGTGVKVLNSDAAVARPHVTGSYTPAGTVSSFGSGLPHATIQPTLLVTNYIKL